MKHPTGNPSTLFCEQVSTVTLLFEKWNDCERAVVMYALLKRLSFPTLKFLQFSIESNLTQNFGSQKNLNSIEANANDTKHLQKLVNIYKSFSIAELSQIADKDSILYESDLYLKDADKNYNNKEDVLHDILNMIPLLKPGNDEAKKIYLSLIPLAVEDTVRQIVAAELVQQIFSYLLIHPAISNEDRRSLSYWLRHLEDHIQSSFASGQRSFYILTNPNETPPESLNTSFSSMNSTQQNPWQAIAPPASKQHLPQHPISQQLSNLTLSSLNSASSTSSSDWNLNILNLQTNGGVNNASSSQNSLGIAIESNESDNVTEDTHISFSKNGTEVLDFDDNSDEGGNCNTQVAYIGDHLHVPGLGNVDNPALSMKTRRSNSLTTPSTSSTVKTIGQKIRESNSTENLTQFAQKPRSYSLSIESPRNSLQSSGSEPRLDDLKPNYLKFTTHNVGMSNIGQWLKSLRLHKYVGLFTNMTYEDMMQINEEYLQSLGVTKGASHKLELCIEKLKHRFTNLSTLEANLLENKVALGSVIEELANLVLTPMKPVDNHSGDNVAAKFLEVLDIVSQMVIERETSSTQDEEHANGTLWILERALHSEAFVSHTNVLKEYKFKLSKIKMQFLPKTHHSKGNTSNTGAKSRWNSAKGRKTDGNSKSGSSDRIHRKNSSDASNFPQNSYPQQQQNNLQMPSNNNSQHYPQESDKFQSSSQRHQGQFYNTNNMTCPTASSSTNSQYKSASYPSFSGVGSTKAMHQAHRQEQQLPQHQQQYRHHRHSFNNLIVLSNAQHQPQQPEVTFGKAQKPSAGTLTLNQQIRPPAQLSQSSLPLVSTAKDSQPPASVTARPLNRAQRRDECNATNGNDLKGHPGSLSKSSNSKNIVGDINSSLELLCLQMTEQAMK
ncbi:unnamed protein product [Hermetia illucens]|uniref:Protein Smaug n=1 Tax=Hermetia illucens TaxID=343691 RepID=A0A7R8YQH6_HERIL|nr:protein Smaug [Hermetia illucens]CAD7081678.1 unnamed protein product [Hermetia illucens]